MDETTPADIVSNKATVAAFDQLLGSDDLSTLDQLCRPDMVNHTLAPDRPRGLAGTREFLETMGRHQMTHEGWSRLVWVARASGANVEFVVKGERRDLPPAVVLSMYRIVEEALTNALRHAPGSRTRVRLRYREEDVSIEVIDDGPGADGGEPGHGLIGMRERAELFGGTFTAGGEPGGGFGVRARLPVGGAP